MRQSGRGFYPSRERLYAFGPPWAPWPKAVERSRHRPRRRAGVREAILALLAERPMHGYEMIQEIERRSRGCWRPSPGSVYPTLQALEGEGLIAGQPAEGGRKRLHLTEAGHAAQPDEPVPAPWERFRDEYGESALDIRATLHGIMHSVGEVLRVGTEGQHRRAGEVLDRARRELHRILAERE